MLFPELAGDADNHTDITVEERFGERIFAKICWFIVVKEGRGYCTCLSIHTYRRRGVTKLGISARHHAPLVVKGQKERLLEGEEGLLPALHVILENESTIDPLARINFSKIYTVEQNVKVRSIGRIAPEDIPELRRHWVGFLEGQSQGECNS